MRESPAPGRLVSIRLTDVPLEIRMRAAAGARLSSKYAHDKTHPEDRLFAKLLGGDHDDLLDVAREPSNRVYWITERAYRSILG